MLDLITRAECQDEDRKKARVLEFDGLVEDSSLMSLLVGQANPCSVNAQSDLNLLTCYTAEAFQRLSEINVRM